MDEKSNSPDIDVESQAFKRLQRLDLTLNMYRDGQWGGPSQITLKTEPEYCLSQHVSIQQETWGDVTAFTCMDDVDRSKQSPTSLTTYFAGVSDIDVSVCHGNLSSQKAGFQENILGVEVAGRMTDGRPVMACLLSTFRTTIDTQQAIVLDIPSEWTLEEAATVPAIYAMAVYGLLEKANIFKGQTVMVHYGAGDLGQAAINIALARGCDVFTTVTSDKRRDVIRKLFPSIKADHIALVTDLEFENKFMMTSNGRGVNVIVGNASGDVFRASVSLLSHHGTLIHIGKFRDDTTLSLSDINKEVTIHNIDLCRILGDQTPDGSCVRDKIKQLMIGGIADGSIRPLERIVFYRTEADKAIQYMKTERPVGKVILKFKDEEVDSNSPIYVSPVLALKRSMCKPGHSYVIMGGLGGFGLELADWLVRKGCQHLVLSSRRGVVTGYQSYKLRCLKEKGAAVKVSLHNAVTFSGAEALLQEAAQMGPLGGVFNVSLVLRDALILNQTPTMFSEVCSSKIDATMHLDKLTRNKYRESVHWFVVFSSQTAARGNKGQTNYGFANSSMERICETRKAQGLPALAIQWGWVGDVGYVSGKKMIELTKKSAGFVSNFLPQSIDSCLLALGDFLVQDAPVVAAYVKAHHAATKEDDDAQETVITAVATILGKRSLSTTTDDTTLSQLGIDSMMVTEIQQLLQKKFDLSLSLKELREFTVKNLKDLDAGVDKSLQTAS